LAIDLFCGLGGWTEGLLAEGYDVVGFDIERHQYWMPEEAHEGDGSKGTRPVAKRGWTQGCAISLGMEGATAKPRTRLVEYPTQLVLQDIMTLHGKQFRNASLIVASPPCQFFSYCAMPWSRAKALAAEVRADPAKTEKELALFDACFRIQREAIAAAGRHIPLIVENVRGAVPWVGRSRWNFGSFHLWGDVPALMPMVAGRKNNGGSWLNIAHNTTSGKGQNPDGRKVPGFRFDGSGKSFQTAAVEGTKTLGHVNKRDGHGHTRHLTNQRESDAVKCGGDWFNSAEPSEQRKHGSKSNGRKAASAAIAKIPFALSQHIARTYYPRELAA
jgi:hypothetical protein